MTNEEAKKMLEAKLECLKNETSGINYDCNMRLCDACSLNYEQGNMGEQKEALQMGAKALDQISHLKDRPCEDAISREEAIRVAEQGQIQGYEWQFKKLRILPPVIPKRSTGKWIIHPKGGYAHLVCSNCLSYAPLDCKTNYCPDCGANMEVEE